MSKSFLIKLLFVLTPFLILGAVFYHSVLTPIPQTHTVDLNKIPLNSDKLWSIVQSWRVSQGLKPFTKNQILCNIANVRAQDMLTDYSHDKFVQRTNEVLKNTNTQNLPSSVYISENLANAITEQAALSDWLKSASHSAALHKDWTYSCIATKDKYAVQIFSNL